MHFLAYHEKRLRWQEISLLFNKWFIMMLFTDLLILLAIVLKGVGEYMVCYKPIVICITIVWCSYVMCMYVAVYYNYMYAHIMHTCIYIPKHMHEYIHNYICM